MVGTAASERPSLPDEAPPWPRCAGWPHSSNRSTLWEKQSASPRPSPSASFGFRAEVITLSAQLGGQDDAPASSDTIDRASHARVSPILKELDAKVRRGGYPRRLLGAFADDIGAQAATGASVLLAAGSTVTGVGALLPAAAAAASVPFLRALPNRLKVRDELRGNRLFFLHEAARQIDRTSRDR